MNKTRAVAYIRVSTEKDAQLHSYEFQEQYWEKAFDGDPGTELVRIYAAKGISGHSVRKRPQFLLMMQDARDHKFDKIYTKSVSRFIQLQLAALDLHKKKRDMEISATEYTARVKEYSNQMQALEDKRDSLQSTDLKYAEVKTWLDTFTEQAMRKDALTAVDGVTMKMLVERIIARETSIEVIFKCGVTIEKEYVR